MTRRPAPRLAGVLVLIAMLCAIAISTYIAAPALADVPSRTIKVPMTIDYLMLAAALKHQVYTQNGRAPLWNGANDCEYLYAENPVFSRAADKVRLETGGSLSIGMPMGERCISPIAWNGIIQADTQPYVAGHMLKFRVADLNLLNPQHQKTLLAGRGFDLVKQYFIPQLEAFEFDLNPATQQLTDLAEAASPPLVAERIKTTLASVRALPEIAALDDGIRATVELTLPPIPVASPAPAPAPLSPQELAAFEKLVDQWDAFLVFSIKQLGGMSTDKQFRADLLDLLLDSRHRLVDALAHPNAGGPDPVRVLFLDVWKRMGEIVRAAAMRGTLGDRSLEFLSFISAGDALFALDQAAPALGMQISADDLRRLAHIMAPAAKGDPLAFSFDEDPELRKMFGLPTPLESPGPIETEPETPAPSTPSPSELPSAPATSPAPSAISSPTHAGTSSAPPSSPTPAHSAMEALHETGIRQPSPARHGSCKAAQEPRRAASPWSGRGAETRAHAGSLFTSPCPGRGRRVSAHAECAGGEGSVALAPVQRYPSCWHALQFCFPSIGIAEDAHAAEVAAPKMDIVKSLQELGKKLRRVVVREDNADTYRTQMDQLLELTIRRELNEEDIDSRYRPIFFKLGKAVAWQESCWRQFRIRRNKVVYLESSSHDVGLMQVNKYVWRGFYSVPRLEWDTIYNAGAGMEILAWSFDDIQDKRGAMAPGKPDELARSTYAAYNGGPSAYRRWRGRESEDERFIDRAFWTKYQAVSRGQRIDILTCAAQWEKTPGH